MIRTAASSLVWGSAMATAAVAGLEHQSGGPSGHVAAIAAVFGLGGAMAWPVAAAIARCSTARAAFAIRLLVAAATVAMVTVGTTAVVYTLQFLFFEAERQATFPSSFWFREIGLITAASLYSFAVVGATLYWPLGLLCLAIASPLAAR